MRTMLFAAPSICNITVGIFLFTFAYAQFGMTSLGTLIYDHEGGGFSRHANFETALRAFSSLVRMSTGDSWSAMLADAVHNPHVARVEPPPIAVVYFFFLFYVGFMGWVRSPCLLSLHPCPPLPTPTPPPTSTGWVTWPHSYEPLPHPPISMGWVTWPPYIPPLASPHPPLTHTLHALPSSPSHTPHAPPLIPLLHTHRARPSRVPPHPSARLDLP